MSPARALAQVLRFVAQWLEIKAAALAAKAKERS